MGILSFLFGSPREAPEPAAPSSRSENVPTAEQFEDPLAWFAAQLRRLGEQCEQAGVRIDRAGETCELRAIWQKRPIRIELGPDGRGELELGLVNRRGHFCLIGHEGETIEGDFRHDPDEIVNLPIAPGIALQSRGRFVEDDRRTFESLPAPLREHLLQHTRAHWGAGPIVRHQSVWLSCAVWPSPERSLVSMLEDQLAHAAELADTLADGPTPVESRTHDSTDRVTCAYCQTPFWPERSDPRCPSCGAAGP